LCDGSVDVLCVNNCVSMRVFKAAVQIMQDAGYLNEPDEGREEQWKMPAYLDDDEIEPMVDARLILPEDPFLA